MPDLFLPTMSDQIKKVSREIAMRARVYPRMINQGKLSQDKADRQLATMRAVLATLESAAR